jgi:hypothetical protein
VHTRITALRPNNQERRAWPAGSWELYKLQNRKEKREKISRIGRKKVMVLHALWMRC